MPTSISCWRVLNPLATSPKFVIDFSRALSAVRGRGCEPTSTCQTHYFFRMLMTTPNTTCSM